MEKLNSSVVTTQQVSTLVFDTTTSLVEAISGAQNLPSEETLPNREITPIRALKRANMRVSPYLLKDFGDFQRRAGVNNPMSADDCLLMIKDLVDKYTWLTIADFRLVLKKALCGEYGQFYERISQPKVFGWFAEYAEERANAFEEANYQKHLQAKAGEPTYDMDVEKWYAAVLHRQEASEEQPVPMSKEELERQKAIIAELYPKS